MECKSAQQTVSFFLPHGELIETLWNVNITLLDTPESSSIELIETLWNVNELHFPAYKFCPLELIETLWNVNI